MKKQARGKKRVGKAAAGSTRHSLFLATVVLCSSPHNTQHDHNWLKLGTAPYFCVWEKERVEGRGRESGGQAEFVGSL